MTESFDFEGAFNHDISESDDEVLNMEDLDDLGLFDFNFENNGGQSHHGTAPAEQQQQLFTSIQHQYYEGQLPQSMLPCSYNAVNNNKGLQFQSMLAKVPVVHFQKYTPRLIVNPNLAPVANTSLPIQQTYPSNFSKDILTDCDHAKARRKKAIEKWRAKRMKRQLLPSRLPEYDCRRAVANKRPRKNGRFTSEVPQFIPVTEF